MLKTEETIEYLLCARIIDESGQKINLATIEFYETSDEKAIWSACELIKEANERNSTIDGSARELLWVAKKIFINPFITKVPVIPRKAIKKG